MPPQNNLDNPDNTTQAARSAKSPVPSPAGFAALARKLLYGHYWIALAAASASLQTALLLHQPLDTARIAWALMLFGAVLMLYNAHRYWGATAVGEGQARFTQLPKSTARLNIGIGVLLSALGGCAYCCFGAPNFTPALLLVPAAAWLYLLPFGRWRLRDLPLLKVPYLAAVWAAATVCLPAENEPSRWLFAAIAVYICLLTLVFDVRDAALDRREGTLTWARLLGDVPTICLSVFALLLWAALVPATALRLSGLLTAAAIAAMLFCPKARRSSFYYAFVLDGQIILQSLLCCVFA